MRNRRNPAIDSILRVLAASLAFCAAGAGADAPLPKAETILDKYIEATGGKAAYEKVRTEITSITLEIPQQGIKLSMTSYKVPGDRSYVEAEIPGAGKIESGTDGTVAWEKSAMMGPRIKNGPEKAQAFRESGWQKDLRWRDVYAKVETAGTETVGDQACYKVVLTPKEGNAETRCYDQKSGLLVKLAIVLTTQMGDIPSETRISNYKTTDGILSPHRVETKAGVQELVFVVNSVKYNEAIPEDRFKVPADIQALLDKAKPAAAK